MNPLRLLRLAMRWRGVLRPRRAPGAGAPPRQPAGPSRPALPPGEARLLLGAMIAMAAADGAATPRQRGLVLHRLHDAGLPPAVRDAVMDEFANPATPEALAATAGSDRALAARLHAAAREAAGTPPSPAEAEWLDRLARALTLTPEDTAPR